MYAAVRRYEGVTDPAEAGRRVNEGFVPLMRQVPGFVAYYCVDAGDGVMVSTSVFEDRAGAGIDREGAGLRAGQPGVPAPQPSPGHGRGGPGILVKRSRPR
jgi:hypothetical protein